MENMMKIKQLYLQNYGRFEDLTIDFAPTEDRASNVTVIVGNNGAGKSQILQALATGLSWFINLLLDKNEIDKKTQIRMDDTSFTYDYEGNYIPQKMIKNSSNKSEIFIKVVNDKISNTNFSIQVDSSKLNNLNQASRGIEVRGLSEVIHYYQNLLKKKTDSSLPLIAFYSVSRNVEIEEIHSSFNFMTKQIKGYQNALTAGSDYFNFFQWFRDNEDLENEKNKDKIQLSYELDELLQTQINLHELHEYKNNIDEIDFEFEEEKYRTLAKISAEIEETEEKYNSLKIRNHLLHESLKSNQNLSLKFVRQAIEEFTEFKNPHIRRQGTPTMIVEKDGEELDINQLSQGEKSLLALVGDIARRLAILNPSLDDPLQGEGVVMIDEVDLHLHPKWQHDLIDKLVKTFPNVQFILTTHSPHIVSDRQDILVYSLDNGQLQIIGNVYGEDANTVLNDVFHVPYRTPEIDKAFNGIRRAISHKELESAESQINNLAKKVSSSNTELLKVKLMLAQAKLAQNKVS